MGKEIRATGFRFPHGRPGCHEKGVSRSGPAGPGLWRELGAFRRMTHRHHYKQSFSCYFPFSCTAVVPLHMWKIDRHALQNLSSVSAIINGCTGSRDSAFVPVPRAAVPSAGALHDRPGFGAGRAPMLRCPILKADACGISAPLPAGVRARHRARSHDRLTSISGPRRTWCSCGAIWLASMLMQSVNLIGHLVPFPPVLPLTLRGYRTDPRGQNFPCRFTAPSSPAATLRS